MERVRRAWAWVRGAAAPADAAAEPQKPSEGAEAWATARVVANVVLWALQLAASDLNALTGTGEGIGGAYAADGPLVTALQPAGAFFAIWALIYAATLAFVVWQALPAQRHNALSARVGWFSILSWVFLGCWGGVASAAYAPDSLGVQATLLALMLALLRCVWLALRCTSTYGGAFTPGELWCCAAPLGLLAGWLTLAAALNAAVVALLLGASGLAPDAGAGGVALACCCVLALGALGAALAFVTRANPFFAAAFAWGLAGTAVAAARRGTLPLQATAAAAATAVLLALLMALATGPPKWGWASAGAAALGDRLSGDAADLGRVLGRACAGCGACVCCCAPQPGEETLLLASSPRRKPRRLARLWRYLGVEDASSDDAATRA